MDGNHQLVMDPKLIFVQYSKGWLLIDVISVLPVNYFLAIGATDKNAAAGGTAESGGTAGGVEGNTKAVKVRHCLSAVLPLELHLRQCLSLPS
eukprot:SAG22_NODE_13288_length_411_cov_1.157051_1_plen_92_part_01